MVLTSRTDAASRSEIRVLDLSQAEYWLNVHQRYSVQDAERMNRIEERLSRLERVPFVRLWLRMTNAPGR